jgi:hypothetical protein
MERNDQAMCKVVTLASNDPEAFIFVINDTQTGHNCPEHIQLRTELDV